MKYKKIICLDNIFREEFKLAKEFFYNLIREPILQATGLNIGSSPHFYKYENNMKNGFCLKKFKFLCKNKKWNELYNSIPRQAKLYLLSYLSENILIISYEMPKWLEKICKEEKIDYLDIRISPLRFARDLYIAIKTNNSILSKRLKQFEVFDEEIRLETALIEAQARHNLRPKKIEDGDVIFVGQTSKDASLVNEKGDFYKLNNFDIEEFILNKKVYYIPHPDSKKHAEYEFNILSKFTNQVEYLDENCYNLLASTFNVTFIGISSGVLQEAKYFNKKSICLHKNICELEGKYKYIQIHFKSFIEPIFWHKVLKIKKTAPRFKSLTLLQPDMLRTIHNVWWGYSKFKKQNSLIDKDAFLYSGGMDIEQRLKYLEIKIKDM